MVPQYIIQGVAEGPVFSSKADAEPTTQLFYSNGTERTSLVAH